MQVLSLFWPKESSVPRYSNGRRCVLVSIAGKSNVQIGVQGELLPPRRKGLETEFILMNYWEVFLQPLLPFCFPQREATLE